MWLATHVHQVPAVVTRLKTYPMAMALDLNGGGMEVKVNVTCGTLLDPSLERSVAALVGA
jgi:hypothetical protein